jgi:hypothetical protein
MSSSLIFQSAAEPVRERLLDSAAVATVRRLVVVNEDPQVLALGGLPVNGADLPYSDLAAQALNRKTQYLCSLVRIQRRELAAATLHEKPDGPQGLGIPGSAVRLLPRPIASRSFHSRYGVTEGSRRGTTMETLAPYLA